MNYIDVYFARRNHMGETVAEIAKNTGEQSFLRWLQDSPHRVDNLSVERGIHFSAIILHLKDGANKKTMTLNVSNSTPIVVGDIVNWSDENGDVEKWIIYRKEKKVNGTYQTFEMIRCNYYLKWINRDGFIVGSWVYFVSSMDAKIKENFRTWNSLITPQYNKFAELIMPFVEMDRQTKFIINQEAWYVIEFDQTSVKGITYLSLSEDKINAYYDDMENEVANMDTAAHFDIIITENKHMVSVGDNILPMFFIMKNGKKTEEDVIYSSKDDEIVRINDNKIIAIADGVAVINIALKCAPEVNVNYEVVVNGTNSSMAYLESDAIVKVGRKIAVKVVYNKHTAPFNFYIKSGDELASIVDVKNDECCVLANEKNKLGFITVVAENKYYHLEKEIRIIPLW